jgi:DNA-binding CsgD family transcriptional regulator
MDGYHRQFGSDLTPREREVIVLMARGLTNGEIAEQLGIAFDTAKSHVSAVIAKLGADSREDAVRRWQGSQRVRVRAERAVRALVAGVGIGKLAVGATAVAVFAVGAAAGAVWLANGAAESTVMDGRIPVPPALMPEPAPGTPPVDRDGTAPWTLIEPIGPDIDITSVQAGDRTMTLGMYQASLGWCKYVIDEESRAQGGRMCAGPIEVPHLLGSREVRKGGVVSGMTERVADRVQLVMDDGSTIEVPLVEAPSTLGLTWRFWLASLDDPNLLQEVRLLSAGGAVIESSASLGAAEGPPPYAEVDISGSGRDEPLVGTVPTGTYRGSVFKIPAGTDSLRFRVEHDGEHAIRVSLQCSAPLTEPMSLRLFYTREPGAGGSGTFEAERTPLGETCVWFVSGYDGNYRIRAMP